MGKQPAAIIIARHGTRLDQADKDWRENAEHPYYDPPLSYGGWIQCQTLGARIDRELNSLEQLVTPADLEAEDKGLDAQRPRKKRKIIIHSSPYKRCVQTSIAIAAGLKYPQPETLRPLPTSLKRASVSNKRSSLPFSTSNFDFPPPARNQSVTQSSGSKDSDKIELKIDPYLGEWLSTSYFEDSKPPPSNETILERAQETMTRPLQEIRGADLNAFLPVPESPEDDKENDDASIITLEKGGLRAMAVAGHSLPHRTRNASFASFGVDRLNGTGQSVVQKLRQRARTTNVYSPPVPQYSLAPQDPIPYGYVAHARDQCVEPDLEWDSVAQGWGNCGTYPEEWSTMHVRFRLGLQHMMAFYQHYKEDQDHSDQGEPEEDVVVVLVTHQAGANALIRLMTGAPALHDVGVASLTLAVRRPVLRRPPSLAGTSYSPLGYNRDSRRISRRGSLDLGLADEFEMKVIASTEHLRFGSNPLGLNSPRLGRSPAMSGRKMVGADSLEGFSIGDPVGWRSSSFGISGRSASGRTRTIDGPSKPSINTGLWGTPPTSAVAKGSLDQGMDDLPPVSPRSRPVTPGVETDGMLDIELSHPTSRSRSNTVQSPGLWGSVDNTNSNPVIRSVSGEAGGTWGSGLESIPKSTSGPGIWAPGSTNRGRSPPKRRWTAVSSSP